MIEQIKNLNLKSFKDYSTPPNFFKNKNVIFGYNGRGKSSLSNGIINTYKDSGASETSFRFFNADYVSNTLLLNDDDSLIKGVKISFSKNDADIAEKIVKIKSKIIDVHIDEKQCSKSRDLLREHIDKIHDSKKGKANIKRKQSKFTIEEILQQYKSDLDSALKINSNREYIKNFSADIKKLENDRNKIINAELPNLNITKIPQDDLDFLEKSLNKQYPLTDDMPTTSEVIKWLEKGIELHNKAESKCKFCHNTLNLQDVKNRIKTYQQNSKRKDISRLEKIKDTLSDNKELVTQAKSKKMTLTIIEMGQDEINRLFSFKQLHDIDTIIEKIDEKISNMNLSISLKNHILDFETEVEQVNSTITKTRNDKINEINITISNVEKLAKGSIAIAIEDSDIQKNLEEIQESEKKIESTKESNKKYNEEIRKLEESQSEYKDFMEFLNEILTSLGIQIELILENNNYYLKHSLDNINLSISNISEGEKNLLALLYFYFELYKDSEQKELKDDLELVVIDDPISSLDETNRFYVLEMMKKILSEDNIQLFLLTHSWDDFCQITYGIKVNNDKYGLFEVFKNPDKDFHSEIRTCQQNITPYKKLFLEIYQLKDKKTNELDSCDTYHAANSMRRIFEEFLYFKKPGLLPQRNNQNEIQEIYQNATGKEVGNNFKRRLGALLTFINVLSHRPIKSEEIIENSKTLMRFIEDIDKVHFDEMKR
ncbi:AAA family ATPase [Streptococcus pneumoniae]